MKKITNFLIIIALLGISVGCSSKAKLLKSTNYEAKYEAAMKAYEKKDYYTAVQFFENLSLYYRGKDKAETVSLYYAKSLLGLKDYFTAAYQFKMFIRQFPYSEHAEEALFQSAYCKYTESPVYSLDQTSTKGAIADFQEYINRYPNSPRIPEVNKYMDELREKLITKAYENAIEYYKIESYAAATIALRNLLTDYPDSPYREQTMFYIIKSGYELAKNSVTSKKLERYRKVVNDFDKFSATFTSSKYISEVQAIYNNTQTEIAKLTTKK